MLKSVLGCMTALALLLSSCGENGLKPAPVAAEHDPFVSAYGMKTPVPMTRSEVLQKVGLVKPASKGAKVAGYIGTDYSLYRNRSWQLKEYDVNQAWSGKYGNPHAANSCWWNSTLWFNTGQNSSGQFAPDGAMYVENICNRADAGHLAGGIANNDLRFLSEETPSGWWSTWDSFNNSGFMGIKRYDQSNPNAYPNKTYIIEVWEGGHLFLIRTDSYNGQFAYEKYHYVQI